MRSVLRLLVGTMAIMITVLASLGPIVAFFAMTTTSYSFMKLLNVAVFAVCGLLGGGFLLRTLQRLTFVAEAADRADRAGRERAAGLAAPVVTPPVANGGGAKEVSAAEGGGAGLSGAGDAGGGVAGAGDGFWGERAGGVPGVGGGVWAGGGADGVDSTAVYRGSESAV